MATTINPVVHYRDLDAGARFLVEAFGFVQHAVHKADDGSIQYVETPLNAAPLGLGPHTEGAMFDTGPAVVYISLDEVDSTHERARAAGAEILMAPPTRTTARGTSSPRTARATSGLWHLSARQLKPIGSRSRGRHESVCGLAAIVCALGIRSRRVAPDPGGVVIRQEGSTWGTLVFRFRLVNWAMTPVQVTAMLWQGRLVGGPGARILDRRSVASRDADA